MEAQYALPDSLTNNEILRYGRQLILPEFGVTRQQLLKSKSALVVGCGGLGCPAAIFLSAAGIGKLGLVDYDEVEMSNLHRQILHKEKAVGSLKTESVMRGCEELNSLPEYRLHQLALSSSNAFQLISEYDVVLDCTDNMSTRYLLNDACVLAKKPLVSGSALKFEGQLTVYNYKDGPCYRCLYPVPPPAHAVTSCSEGGVMGVIPGIIGTMQAQEAIKVLTSLEGTLSGRLFLYDGLRFSTHIVKLRPQQSTCAICGDKPTITQLIDYVEFCAALPTDNPPAVRQSQDERISVEDYKDKYLGRNNHILVDVRPVHEIDICRFSYSTNIPLNQLLNLSRSDLSQALQLPAETAGAEMTSVVICLCHHGNDSQVAAKYIKNMLADLTPLYRVVDITGGLDSWAKLVDDNFPRY